MHVKVGAVFNISLFAEMEHKRELSKDWLTECTPIRTEVIRLLSYLPGYVPGSPKLLHSLILTMYFNRPTFKIHTLQFAARDAVRRKERQWEGQYCGHQSGSRLYDRSCNTK